MAKINGKAGNDTLIGGLQADQIFGSDGDDTLKGGAGNDSLYGGDDDDSLYGGEGKDWLIGGTGNDTIYGESLNDRLVGGAGADMLFGGWGSDNIVVDSEDVATGGDGQDRFEVIADASSGAAKIQDFTKGEDAIEIHYPKTNPRAVPELTLGLKTGSTSDLSISLNGAGVAVIKDAFGHIE